MHCHHLAHTKMKLFDHVITTPSQIFSNDYYILSVCSNFLCTVLETFIPEKNACTSRHTPKESQIINWSKQSDKTKIENNNSHL